MRSESAAPRRATPHGRNGLDSTAVKHRLEQIRYDPDLADDCLAGTGLLVDG